MIFLTLKSRFGRIISSASLVVIALLCSFCYADTETAVIQTNYGDITIALYSDDVPKTVKHFKRLVTDNIYTNVSFYRAVKDQYIQGGIGYGIASKRLNIQGEFNAQYKNVPGAVGFARQALDDANSGTTELYILLGAQPSMDDSQFTIFGGVIEGFDVLEQLSAVPVKEQYLHWHAKQGWVDQSSPDTFPVPWHKPLKAVVIKNIRLNTLQP